MQQLFVRVTLCIVVIAFGIAQASWGQDNPEAAIITCGNSGVGKSFLDNIILWEKDTFKHKYTFTSVTRLTEYVVRKINGVWTAVYNIPGLIESKDQNLKANVEQIELAFAGKEAQIILYVFGVGDGGKIRHEDVETYRALYDSYNFDEYSLIFVVNNVDPEADLSYKTDLVVYLKQLLALPLEKSMSLVFINKFNKDDAKNMDGEAIRAARVDLLRAIKAASPHKHTLLKPITVDKERLKQLKEQHKTLLDNIEITKVEHATEVNNIKVELEKMQADNRQMAETYKKIIDVIPPPREAPSAPSNQQGIDVCFYGFCISGRW